MVHNVWFIPYGLGNNTRLKYCQIQTLYSGCQCSIDGNCNRPPHLFHDPICNCDTMYPGSEDDGDLTAKERLPVMKLSYGGSFSPHSSIKYILGPLICSGKWDQDNTHGCFVSTDVTTINQIIGWNNLERNHVIEASRLILRQI